MSVCQTHGDNANMIPEGGLLTDCPVYKKLEVDKGKKIRVDFPVALRTDILNDYPGSRKK